MGFAEIAVKDCEGEEKCNSASVPIYRPAAQVISHVRGFEALTKAESCPATLPRRCYWLQLCLIPELARAFCAMG